MCCTLPPKNVCRHYYGPLANRQKAHTTLVCKRETMCESVRLTHNRAAFRSYTFGVCVFFVGLSCGAAHIEYFALSPSALGLLESYV